MSKVQPNLKNKDAFLENAVILLYNDNMVLTKC